jgi:hypothetical protein
MATRANGRGGPAKPQAPGKPNAPAKPQAPAKPNAPAKPQAPANEAPAGRRPAALRLAAAVEVIQAAGLCVAGVFAAIGTADGKSYQVGSGIALTLIAFGAAAGIAVIAVALARARPWSRTPTAMIQLFAIIGGITLLDGHRPAWGVPALALAAACLAGLFTPASLRALNRPPVKRE